MARRKIRTLHNSAVGQVLTQGVDIFPTPLDLQDGNLLRISFIPRTSTKLLIKAGDIAANFAALNNDTNITATSDNIFESSYNTTATGKFQARVSVTTPVDKFLVEVFLDS